VGQGLPSGRGGVLVQAEAFGGIMTRHGIVLPLPNVVPPPECRGGPAYCEVCNAEMIELESQAIRLAANEERRYGYEGTLFEALWKSRSYRRAHFRNQARRLILIRHADEGEWRLSRSLVKGGHPQHADNAVSRALGLSLKQYRRRQHAGAAALAGISAREWYRRRRAARRKTA
jgi:hypothetical protein